MRIAQVAPLHESVPPRAYGGTERVVHWLSEGLAERGHEVTVFASGDSFLQLAELVPVWPRSLRASGDVAFPDALHAAALERALARRPAFDVIHSHVDWIGLPLATRSEVPIVTTLHGRLDLPEFIALARASQGAPLVSISDAQRKPVPHARWIATVHHGLALDRLPMGRGGEYLVFIGRISREKRPDLAIRVARAAGIPLKIAAKVNGNEADREYWEREIRPMLGDGIEFIGEVGDEQKAELLGGALALLFPVDWPEPFGLVAIEAMACGTPVITRPYGALPEIVVDGRTGFLVESEGEMVSAVRAVRAISREACRAHVRQRFSVERMVREYEAVYRSLRAGDIVEATV